MTTKEKAADALAKAVREIIEIDEGCTYIYGHADSKVFQALADYEAANLVARGDEVSARDSERLDWLERNPLPAQVHGGSDDGTRSKVWAISCHPKWTLREAIDAAKHAKDNTEAKP